MKFICKKCCLDDGEDPCKLNLPGRIKYLRDDWKKALRRCPFESIRNNKLTGEVPIAKWERVK